ncbi:MAG: alpha/beta fold hydrolase [Candidatus Eremiobacteraeota bacterium]|nr:alpha/beta fold hydrolase [Candidatus Eremiobacteraeota bacterium]
MSDPFQEGLVALARLQALDGSTILPAAGTQAWLHGERRPLCVLLFHGLTNNPAQFAAFGPALYERGANVIAVRLPHHGESDRLTTKLARLRSTELVATLDNALEIAALLGERTAVMGHSTGGTLAAYGAQFRSGIELAIPVCPGFAVLRFSRPVSRAIMLGARIVPNLHIWWDPELREGFRPAAAYPRFSTRAVAAVMRIADATFRAARRTAPLAKKIRAVVVARDPAVNNLETQRLVERWQRHGADATYEELITEPLNHDPFDPDSPRARTESTYPMLLSLFDDLLSGTPS